MGSGVWELVSLLFIVKGVNWQQTCTYFRLWGSEYSTIVKVH